MNSDQAQELLRSGTVEEAVECINLSRQQRSADEDLWQAVLDYFTTDVPDCNRGFFSWWYCATLTTPQRGERGLREIFSRMDRPSQTSQYAANLEEPLREPRFAQKRRWLALQGPLLTSLAQGWQAQPPSSDAYACSHNTIICFARVFLPVLQPSMRAALARACLESLRQHDQPPAHGSLYSYPEVLKRELTAQSIPTLVAILETGLKRSPDRDLKPYLRKQEPLSPSSDSGLQLCLNALEVLTEHPEWAESLRVEAAEKLAELADWLQKVIGLLHTLPYERLKRQPNEDLPTYLARIPPLPALFKGPSSAIAVGPDLLRAPICFLRKRAS